MVAEQLCGTADAITCVDCSELMERHSVSKLIGSPPGEQSFCLLQSSTLQTTPTPASRVVSYFVDSIDSGNHLMAGFMGYGEAAGLTEAVRRRPAGVVLFDEVEKVRCLVLAVPCVQIGRRIITQSCMG